MHRVSNFGIRQILDNRFDNNNYHYSTKETTALRLKLQELADKENWLPFINLIQTEFDKIQTEKSNNVIIIQYQINELEDLARSLMACEPNRYVKDERYRYDQDKVCKRATQLDFDIANYIIDLQKSIISTINPKIKLVEKTLFRPYFFPEEQKTVLPTIEPKKRGLFSWLR